MRDPDEDDPDDDGTEDDGTEDDDPDNDYYLRHPYQGTDDLKTVLLIIAIVGVIVIFSGGNASF